MRIEHVCRMIGAAWASALFLTFAAACDDGATAPEAPPPNPIKASDWVKSVDWSKATTVQVNMVEQGTPLSGPLAYSPNNLTFEAGKPYILRIVNAPTNAEKHYFATEGLADFYKGIAVRKVQTTQAEYKAAHFINVELMIGGSLDIYFVPVLPGTYNILCVIPGHKERGMVALVTITGGVGNQLDLEIASDFNTALLTDPRKSSSHAVWSSKVDKTVMINETPYGFIPTDLQVNKDVGYKISIENPAGHASPHYYTAAELYKTVVLRKAEDSQAEVKAPYLSAVELLIGGKTSLFVVPTVVGTFQTLCTIPGHADLGMKGTVVVNP